MTSAPSPSPTFRQIQAQVRAVRSKRGLEGSTVFGIQSAGRWSGKALRRDGEETYQIVQCDSPLALRLALQEPLPAGAYKVLVTGLAQEDLSADILVRITKRRLLPIRSWEIVKDLFQATRVDPRLARHDWLADMLLELAPAGGFPAVQAGVLDAETVWAILLRRRLGLETASPDLIDILDWSLDSERAAGFREAPEAFRRAAREWLRGSAGPAAEVALGALEAGDAPSLAALGIALGVVFHPEAKGALAKAAGKIEERYLGGKPLAPEVADRWAPAATEAVYRGAAPKTRRAVLERADEILVSLQAEPYAWLSDASALGFRQRLVRFGGGLLRVLEGPGPEALAELRKLRESVLSHREAAEAPERTIDRVEMALRLARWLSSRVGREAPAWRSLEEAARDYAGEGGFVDWARHVLSTSEPVRELSEAYGKLRARVTQLRERQNEAFGLLLRDWTAAGSRSTELVPVEEVLDQVVAPLAERVPVLVLCLDGLTFAIARELLEDLLREEWVEVRQEGAPAVRPMLAALPTTTEVCRTSLFCGRLVQGTAADETAGFAEHPRLAPRAKSGSRPRLFHK
ncbi:MAG: BREX-2 system phosphatase PglZ, partial [Planctomycetes bacterium]|nr:BREX-2 system phosphatase PglZ [Planctomycetota bacterium]